MRLALVTLLAACSQEGAWEMDEPMRIVWIDSYHVTKCAPPTVTLESGTCPYSWPYQWAVVRQDTCLRGVYYPSQHHAYVAPMPLLHESSYAYEILHAAYQCRGKSEWTTEAPDWEAEPARQALARAGY